MMMMMMMTYAWFGHNKVISAGHISTSHNNRAAVVSHDGAGMYLMQSLTGQPP